jgi:hypothetical protein
MIDHKNMKGPQKASKIIENVIWEKKFTFCRAVTRVGFTYYTFSYLLDQLFWLWAYRVLQTIQMKLILLCVWAEPAVLGSTKTTLEFKYEILIG